MAKIGFVGLGHMGLPMAINLIKSGHQVTGFDLQEKAQAALQNAGGVAASTLQDAGYGQDVVVTMLQTGEQVKNVCFGERGLMAIASENTLFIDCSSIDVINSRDFHLQANQHNQHAVDAPVSGGVAGAKAATLTFMVGGTPSCFEKAYPILSVMGEKIIHTGQAGSGQAAKLCNNMILGVSMIAVSEAFVLAEKLGLRARKLHEVVTNSSGQCWAMSQYVPLPGILENVPANHDYEPGFTAAMMLKDLNLSQQSAQDADVKTPLGEKAQALYQRLSDEGLGNLDFSAIIKLLQALSKD